MDFLNTVSNIIAQNVKIGIFNVQKFNDENKSSPCLFRSTIHKSNYTCIRVTINVITVLITGSKINDQLT